MAVFWGGGGKAPWTCFPRLFIVLAAALSVDPRGLPAAGRRIRPSECLPVPGRLDLIDMLVILLAGFQRERGAARLLRHNQQIEAAVA